MIWCAGPYLLFERCDPASELGVRAEQLSQLDERTHDLDVHADGAGAAQNAREHRDALLRERVRQVLAVRSATAFV